MREQGHPHLREGLLQIAGHLTGQQLGSPAEPSGHRRLQRSPLDLAGCRTAYADPIGRRPGALDPSLQSPCLHRQILNSPAAGIAPAPLHARPQTVTLQDRREPLRPPLAGQRCGPPSPSGCGRISWRSSSVES